MERQEFQKKLEELGRLAEERENRIRAEEVRDFLKDMELTEEQMELVFAYLASRLVTVEGYVPAKREEEEEAQLTPEEEDFLKQYQKELEYLTLLGEEELLELCEQAENTRGRADCAGLPEAGDPLGRRRRPGGAADGAAGRRPAGGAPQSLKRRDQKAFRRAGEKSFPGGALCLYGYARGGD